MTASARGRGDGAPAVDLSWGVTYLEREPSTCPVESTLSVEIPDPAVYVVCLQGVLDTATCARLLRLLHARVQLAWGWG